MTTNAVGIYRSPKMSQRRLSTNGNKLNRLERPPKNDEWSHYNKENNLENNKDDNHFTIYLPFVFYRPFSFFYFSYSYLTFNISSTPLSYTRYRDQLQPCIRYWSGFSYNHLIPIELNHDKFNTIPFLKGHIYKLRKKVTKCLIFPYPLGQ